ncbi:MAG: type II toxin-antitoxin system PrlF family antitoxin [Deltaproteobacteria bacterium]|nr:type II toxin-antitoxin system PrlF family antitoxin [Deltaproteobacteria bacterium]
MAEATLTSKWQMVIPKPVREHLGLHPGDRVDFLIREDGEVVVRSATADVRALKGLLRQSSRQPVSLEMMQKAVRRRAKELK